MMNLIHIAYLVSATGFVAGLKLMATPARAKTGNIFAATSVVLAITATTFLSVLHKVQFENVLLLFSLLLAGTVIGRYFSQKYEITRMPELISLFNAFGGLCAVLIGVNESMINDQLGNEIISRIVLTAGVLLGGVSFSGSIIAYYKLSGTLRKSWRSGLFSVVTLLYIAIMLVWHFIIRDDGLSFFMLIVSIATASLIYGVLFALPVGGADMPVLISVLNAATGIATAFSGVLFQSPVMLLGGILVGSTGILLTFQMCKAMNRSLKHVLVGNANKGAAVDDSTDASLIRSVSASEVASVLAFSGNIAIIPGFGLAVSQAQKLCYELQCSLESQGAQVKYIIHPVAGRMPGHMNVLLAEADIDYSDIVEMDEVNQNMRQFDVAIVIGANDVVNPAAEEDPGSPVYGMPIIRAYNCRQVIVMKRGMATGYSGIKNTLFERSNCRLLFGDAKTSLQKILEELKKIRL